MKLQFGSAPISRSVLPQSTAACEASCLAGGEKNSERIRRSGLDGSIHNQGPQTMLTPFDTLNVPPGGDGQKSATGSR